MRTYLIFQLLAFVASGWRNLAYGNTCSNTSLCNYEKAINATPITFRMPCVGTTNYPDNSNCSMRMVAADGATFTQIVINKLNVESWHDYLKFDGPTNFIMISNETTNKLSITGYPNDTITGRFISDSDKTFTGFDLSIYTVTDLELLEQYNTSQAQSAVQVMASPLFLTSYNNNGSPLDLMLMNIPNDTASPTDAWYQYVELVTQTNGLNVTDVTSTSFTLVWTVVLGTIDHTVMIQNQNTGASILNKKVTSNTYTVQNLPSGSAFNITVIYNSKGAPGSVTRIANTSTISPTDFKLVKTTQTSLSFTWTAVNGATSYQVILNSTQYTTSGNNSHEITGLNSGTRYAAVLRTIFAAGSEDTGIVSATTDPGDVTGIVVSQKSTTFAYISWNAVSGASGYKVTMDSIKLQVAVSEPYRNVTGLTPGKKYEVKVTTLGLNNQTSFPTSYIFTTDLADKSHSVSVTSATAFSITVSWTTVANANEYKINVTKKDGTEVSLGGLTVTSGTTYKIEPLAAGTMYKVTVIAISEDTQGVVGNLTTATNMTKVSSLKVDETTTSSLKIVWNHVNGPSKYIVKRLNNTAEFNTNQTSYEFSSLNHSTSYQISVKAVFEVGTGPANVLTAWTVPGGVTNFEINGTTTNSFTPFWDMIPDMKYELEVKVLRTSKIQPISDNAISGQSYTVDPGTKYNATVKARNPYGDYGEARATSFNTNLSQPEVTFESITKFGFLLKWKKVQGASKYEVKCDQNGVNVAESTTVDSHYLVDGLKAQTSYSCSVIAVSEDGVNSTMIKKPQTTADSSCKPDTCQNGGTCQDLKNDYECDCKKGYEGKVCQDIYKWCEKEHKDKCKDNTLCRDTPTTAKCECLSGYRGNPEVGCKPFCAEDVKYHKGLNLTFQSAEAGIKVYSDEKCNVPNSGEEERSYASWTCELQSSGQAVFAEFLFVDCDTTIKSIVQNVNSLNDSKILKNETARLSVVTSAKIEPEAVEEVANLMKNISDEAKKENTEIEFQVLVNLADTTDNLIRKGSLKNQRPTLPTNNVTSSPVTTPITQNEVKAKILESLTTLAEQVTLPGNSTNKTIETVAMVLQVIDVDDSETNKDFEFAPVVQDSFSGTTDNDNPNNTVQPVKITLPPEAITEAKKALEGVVGSVQRSSGNSTTSKKLRISFILHKDHTLFPSSGPTPSTIVSASLGLDYSLRLPDGKYITMQYNESKKAGSKKIRNKFYLDKNEYKCRYWNVSRGEWSSEGCCWKADNASNLAQCQCNHLTNFALLVATTELKRNVPLEIYSTVGMVLSMIGLIATMVVHALKEDVRKRRPTQILFHICFNLLAANIVFIVGINKNENRVICHAITAIIHFFWLASWCWMTVYAYDMYRSLVLVFGAGKTRYMTKCSLFGYGVPLLITIMDVAIAVGAIDPRKKPEGVCDKPDGNYQDLVGYVPIKSAYRAENICWIHEFSLYFGFLAPVAIMLIFNIFVYGMVIKTLAQRGKAVKSSAKKTSIKDNIFISITLISSTGISWIFGYLMLISTDEGFLTAMSWIFAIMNTIQGFIIFMSTCVRNENMRKLWVEPIMKCFSSAGSRIHLIPSRHGEFQINTRSTDGSSAFLSTTDRSTKDTGIKSVSVTNNMDESAI